MKKFYRLFYCVFSDFIINFRPKNMDDFILPLPEIKVAKRLSLPVEQNVTEASLAGFQLHEIPTNTHLQSLPQNYKLR